MIDVDRLDRKPSVTGLRQLVQAGRARVALGGDDVPAALEVFLREGEAKAARRADQQQVPVRGKSWHLQSPVSALPAGYQAPESCLLQGRLIIPPQCGGWGRSEVAAVPHSGQ